MYCPTCKETFANGAFCAKDGTALVDKPETSLVGQVLADRYRIVRLLGEGGMGQVYEAQHLNINKRFAIKMLRPEVIGSAQSLQRFRQEAWAASSIGHDHIVEIDDFATLPSGQVYLAMEFLDGQSLAERLRDGEPLALADAVAIIIAVGNGLAAAHDKGIVHRDMKPENIFLARKSGRVVAKILDFGIAKMTGGDEPSNLTRTGAIFGTPLYMSPEQAKGKPADARADVYALGVILYELVTGSVPFGGDSSVEILSQHIGSQPVPPAEVAPERAIPPQLEAVILRALAKEPEGRFASMAELVTELEAVAATLPAPDLTKLVTTPPAPPTGWNAQIKTPGATTPRPAAATPRPAARTPSGATPRGAAASQSPSQPPASRAAAASAGETDSALEPPSDRGARTTIVALAALVIVGGAVAVWLAVPHGTRSVPNGTNVVPPGTKDKIADSAAPQPLPAVPAPPSLPAPAPARPREVIVASTPPGAKIVRDGVVTAETPEALALTGVTTVVLRKDGWTDKTVTLDPATTRKIVVKLERAKPARAGAPKPATTSATKPAPAGAGAKAKPGAPVDPYAATAKPATTTKPTATKPAASKPAPVAPPPKPHDELSARVEKQGAAVGHRVGSLYRGAAAEEGGRSDWFVQLEAGHCYTFVGEGGDGVAKLYLYLWGPGGRRLQSTREDTAHARMTYCTAFPGSYHFQAKVDDGHGEYRVGIFTH